MTRRERLNGAMNGAILPAGRRAEHPKRSFESFIVLVLDRPTGRRDPAGATFPKRGIHLPRDLRKHSRLKAILGADHPDVATALYKVARFLQEKGDLKEAEKTFREVLDIRLKKLSGATATWRRHDSLGTLLVLEKHYEDAEPLLFEARASREAAFGAEHEASRKTAAELEKLYEAWGKPPPTAK